MSQRSLVNRLLTTLMTASVTLLYGGQIMASIEYVTRTDAVVWEVESSKFICSLSHPIDGFGGAVFVREAGRGTQFHLKSSMARMKTGKAALIARPPPWSSEKTTNQIASVDVKESRQPITVGRKLSERMLSELERGLLIDFQRQALYGGNQPIRVTISSIGFRESYQEYLKCQSGLLSVNYKQIERSTLNYNNDEEDIDDSAKRRLDALVNYVKEDASVKAIYLDGHTDSEGIRGENLLKSERRAERVFNYLVESGIDSKTIAMRWHGERYPLESNKTEKGKVANRRVTVRLSKEPPQFIVNKNSAQASLIKKVKEAAEEKAASISADENVKTTAKDDVEGLLKSEVEVEALLESEVEALLESEVEALLESEVEVITPEQPIN
jgi:outer membrane protein OmpA-like peptidoglycan-associated protein